LTFDYYPTEKSVEHLFHGFLGPIAIGHQDGHVLLETSASHGHGVVGRHFEQSVGDISQTLFCSSK
jgi:hypothetical protein